MFYKDNNATLDYKVSWSAWLGTDVIISSEWIASPGITINSNTFDDNTATVWLSGGDIGVNYDITNRITTLGGRTDERTIMVCIINK